MTVRDFPAGAPASFNGAVGKFQLNGSLDKQTVTANASDTYLLKLSGSGNLPLIQAPKPELPASFESYGNGKSTESLSHNASGISGYKQFEFPFIPRAEGNYSIPPVEFSYFDPDAAKYVTLTTPPFGVEVLPDSTGGSSGGGIVSGIGPGGPENPRQRHTVHPARRLGAFRAREACCSGAPPTSGCSPCCWLCSSRFTFT